MHRRGRLDEAKQAYGEILRAHPGHFDALHLSGLIAFQTGNAALAADLIAAAISANAGNAAAHSNLGKALMQLGRLDEAVASLDRAIAFRPDDAEVHYHRGVALQGLGRGEAALASYDRAIGLRPDLAEAWNNRAVLLYGLKRARESLASADRALKLRPDYAEAYSNRGTALKDLGRLVDAVTDYDRALSIKPDLVETWSNRGNALRDLGHLDEALASYNRAIEIRADFAEAWNHRGVALHDLRRLDEAVASYDRAIAIKPGYADAHWNLAICRLLSGDFGRGWHGFEWRWKSGWLQEARRDFSRPLWLGAEPLNGKTILLHSEQGLGDTLQFCRYARLVSAAGARVILEVPRTLSGLLGTLEGVAQCVTRGSSLPEFDCHCPLLSLPLAFRTDASSIPAGSPYIQSDSARVAAWRDRLGAGTRPRVGLAWSGSATHRNDRNRSIALEDMLPLLEDRVEWVSLQKEVREGDAGLLASRTDIRHFGDDLHDFADTAALVELLDAIVSVDTSVAHLAGAMGKSVLILLPFNPDWRWLLDRDSSPWYPTARLFRQPAMGAWASVVRAVREELPSLARNSGTIKASIA